MATTMIQLTGSFLLFPIILPHIGIQHLESFEMWCWRRTEKISWIDHVRNEVLLRVNEQRNILREIRKRKANWIGHILRSNCLLKQVIEGKIKGEMDVTRRRGRRRKKLLDDLKDRRGYSHLKEEALDRTMWRNLLEEALDLSSDRLLNNNNNKVYSRNGVVKIAARLRIRQFGFPSLLSGLQKPSPTFGPVPAPTQCVSGILTPGSSGQVVKLISRLHPVPS